jgi:hypothetical protein
MSTVLATSLELSVLKLWESQENRSNISCKRLNHLSDFIQVIPRQP